MTQKTLVVQNKLAISLKVNTLDFNNNTEENLLISFCVSEAKTLINKINITDYAKVKGANFTSNEPINLNNE